MPGRYFQVAQFIYTGDAGTAGPTGVTLAGAVDVCASTFQLVVQDSSGVSRYNATYLASGTTLSVNYICPFSFSDGWTYTVSGRNLTIFARNVQLDYVKQ